MSDEVEFPVLTEILERDGTFTILYRRTSGELLCTSDVYCDSRTAAEKEVARFLAFSKKLLEACGEEFLLRNLAGPAGGSRGSLP